VRVSFGQKSISFAVLLLMLCAKTFAQNPDTMDPEQSTAKAKQILKQLIDTLGGQRYLTIKTSECEGRQAHFGHNGEMSGFTVFKDYWSYPDTRRIDLAKKGNIIDLFIGNEGWTLDRSGVSEEPATAVTDFQEAVKRDPNNLLRYRLNEDRLLITYGGNAVVDLRPVDWVEIVDSEERTYRLAVDQSTHLLVRSVVYVRDDVTGERREDVALYTNYQSKDGVQMPMQISRERDGRRVSQVFYEACQYNPNLPADFFTKAALEKRSSEVGGGKMKLKH
jgi:hypothetical protein